MSLSVPRSALRLTRGEVSSFTRDTDSGGRLECFFCPACGSRLWHAGTGTPDRLTVKAGSLDEPVDAAGAIHIWTSRKMPGIVKMNYSFDITDPAGGRSFFCIFEAYFEKPEDMAASMQTPEGAAVLADLANLETNAHWIFNFPVVEVV